MASSKENVQLCGVEGEQFFEVEERITINAL